jgi:hypothetical protein
VVRAPTSVAVPEVNTWSGIIDRSACAEEWVRHGVDGQEGNVLNAVRQNLVRAHSVRLQRPPWRSARDNAVRS